MLKVRQNNKINWYQTIKYHLSAGNAPARIKGSAMKTMPDGRLRKAYKLDNWN